MTRLLRIAAFAEAITLVVLLVNLLTAHLPAVSSAVGPCHGCAYLAVIIATFTSLSGPSRWTSVIPGIGGLLVLRRQSVTPASSNE